MNKKKTSAKKYVFTLPFTASLVALYKENGIFPIKNVTDVDEIISTFSYSDETRKFHKCIVSKIGDFNSGAYHCYWCRHPFKTQALGCPIKYMPNTSVRTYYSEMTKSNFSVKESVCFNQHVKHKDDIETIENDYYETDGIFCSPNCLLSYIKDNKKNALYIDSETLFYRLCPDKILPAPHWRVLDVYGGPLSIEKFREGFSKMHYEDRGYCKPYRSTGVAYEEFIRV